MAKKRGGIGIHGSFRRKCTGVDVSVTTLCAGSFDASVGQPPPKVVPRGGRRLRKWRRSWLKWTPWFGPERVAANAVIRLR